MKTMRKNNVDEDGERQIYTKYCKKRVAPEDDHFFDVRNEANWTMRFN